MNNLLEDLYKPPSLNEKDFLLDLNNNSFCTTYENITQIGHFNMIPENEELNELKPTCLKGLFPSTIDLILLDHKQSFMKSHVYEAGISDYNKMICSVLRKTFANGKPETVF